MLKVRRFEFGGGLGDMIHQCYTNGYYAHLDRAGVDYERAQINLVVHMPNASQLFQWHPKRHLFDIRELEYWNSDKNKEMRAKYGLDPREALPAIPDPVRWYPSPEDFQTMAYIPVPYVVVAQAAGLKDRNLDVDFTKALCTRLSGYTTARGGASGAPLNVVLIGKTYERFGRTEDMIGFSGERIHNLVDKLTVPGALHLLEKSVGLVTCHSSMNIAAWHMRKPQLLLYPKSVYSRHFVRGDQWSFGRSFRETFHACWDDKALVDMKVEGFIKEITT